MFIISAKDLFFSIKMLGRFFYSLFSVHSLVSYNFMPCFSDVPFCHHKQHCILNLRWTLSSLVSRFRDKSESLLYYSLQGNILALTHSKQDIKWLNVGVCMHSKSHQLRPTLCNPTDCTQQAPLSIGFARRDYRSVVLYPRARDAPHQGIKHESSFISCIGRNVLYHYCHLGSTNYW